MSMFRIFDVSGSAVSAQSQRLNVVVSNAYAFAGNCSSIVLSKFKG